MRKPTDHSLQKHVAAYAPRLVPPNGWKAMTHHQVWLHCLQELSDYEADLPFEEAEDIMQQAQAALYHKHRILFKAKFPTSTSFTSITPWDHSTVWFGGISN
jgi:hypothetical protein